MKDILQFNEENENSICFNFLEEKIREESRLFRRIQLNTRSAGQRELPEILRKSRRIRKSIQNRHEAFHGGNAPLCVKIDVA